jgi:hypothetical protein
MEQVEKYLTTGPENFFSSHKIFPQKRKKGYENLIDKRKNSGGEILNNRKILLMLILKWFNCILYLIFNYYKLTLLYFTIINFHY